MSVTTLLIPVDEAEAEALLAGGDRSRTALAGLIDRARTLRRRVAAVDRVREELHSLLYPHWQDGNGPPGNAITRFLQHFQRKKPASFSSGWDPYVQLFGRSLPVHAANARAVAAALRSLTNEADDTVALRQLADSLAPLDARAATLIQCLQPITDVNGLSETISLEVNKLQRVLTDGTELPVAMSHLARMQAWSRPLWRLDGETLGGLISSLGVEVMPDRPSALFEELATQQPELEPLLESLPTRLTEHDGAGGWLSSSAVKSLAGALRLQRSTLARNAAMADQHPQLVMRHLRLLEEAVAWAEQENLGLLEASGVEWSPVRPEVAGR